MAWASKKQYAICMESEEGKNLIEDLPNMTQDDFNTKFSELLGKSDSSVKNNEAKNVNKNNMSNERKQLKDISSENYYLSNDFDLKNYLDENGKVKDDTRDAYEKAMDGRYEQAKEYLKKNGIDPDKQRGSFGHGYLIDYAKGNSSLDDVVNYFNDFDDRQEARTPDEIRDEKYGKYVDEIRKNRKLKIIGDMPRSEITAVLEELSKLIK